MMRLNSKGQVTIPAHLRNTASGQDVTGLTAGQIMAPLGGD
jgi:bifunctional DNA-binding transcriptional regulator/antitoxin component of YhaV-PrlF toxin-antitoxin module